MGRKKKTATWKETTESQRTINGSGTARNLRSEKLCAVILGCSNRTIRECYTQLLFGLPAVHFSYIQNIKPGMPLFLFNYSDRKIHGIFEAVSSGQMNINPRAWTTDASEITPFAAQVKVKVRKLCEPAVEELYKQVLIKNYYGPKHFWFELDSSQTTRLIDRFISSPAPRSATRMLTPTIRDDDKIKKPEPKLHSSLPQKQGQAVFSNVGWGSEWDECGPELNTEATKQNDEKSMHPFSTNATILPPRRWISLFMESSTHDTSNDNEDLRKEPTEVNLSYAEPYVEHEVSGIPSHLEDDSQYEDWEDHVEQHLSLGLSGEKSKSNVNTEEGASEFETSDGENRATESSGEEDRMVNNSERLANLNIVSECFLSTSEEACNAMKSSGIELAVAKLKQEIEELKAAQSTQTRKVNYLEQELVESKREAKQLQNRCKKLECASSQARTALSIGLVGFGPFAQFLAKTLINQGHILRATSRTDYSLVCNSSGISFYRDMKEFLEEEHEVIVLCTSILSLSQVLNSMPFYLLKGPTLFVDVLSVKQRPRDLLLQVLPEEMDILCTHPMFGPESGNYNWKDLFLVYDKVRIKNSDVCSRFLNIFEREGCKMLEMDCEEHDKQAAGSQFLTHTIGRILSEMKIESTSMNTKGFQTLLQLKEDTMKDSFDLYSESFIHNKYAKEELKKLEVALNVIKRQLTERIDEESNETA